MSSGPTTSTLRAGRYAVIGELGSGSQADTLDAVDKLNGRAVAIKRFQVRGAKSWKDVELAEREARVLSTLSHPNLPVYIEHFEEAGALYLVMEKIEGETLASLRRRRMTLTHADIARFLTDADGVLSYLHSRAPAIIHRDIKPGNVIRRQDGSFAFVDFGSVRDQMKPEGGSTVVGTFGYMAPEQFQGRALPGSDVYAVGATALALVTGREPEDLPHRGLAIDVRTALGNGAEPWLLRVLSSMLEPDPDKRASRVPAPGAGRRASAPASPADLREPRKQRREVRPPREGEMRRVWEEHVAREGLGVIGLMLVMVALSVARLATWALFRMILPTLLFALSVPLGSRRLRRAAWRCRDIGIQGGRGLADTSAEVRFRLLGKENDASGMENDEPKPESAPRTRVPAARRRVQVESESGSDAPPPAAAARQRREPP